MKTLLHPHGAPSKLPYVCARCIQRTQIRFPSTIARVSARQGFRYKYGEKLERAEEEWQDKAARIRCGDQESMLTILEKRGFVNSITEYAPGILFGKGARAEYSPGTETSWTSL